MEDKNKKVTLMIIGALALLVTVLGAAYAYFQAQPGEGTSSKAEVSTNTTDSLTFTTGDDISIYATLENFAQGKGSLSKETTATAKLVANNKTNTATMNYNVFFIIDTNDFVYTTDEELPEIVMKVKNPEGEYITEITGLKSTEGNGFDITKRTGSFLIASNYEITASPEETQNWTVEVTLVNLNSDQNENEGKSLNGLIYITTEEYVTYELARINNVEPEVSSNSIKATLDVVTGTSEIDKYYYGIEKDSDQETYSLRSGIEYIESTEPVYTFEELEENTYYKVYSYALDKEGFISNVYNSRIKTEEYKLPSVESISYSNTMNTLTIKVNAKAGENAVSKYYYSIDDGVTYTDGQDLSEYTYREITNPSEYKIRIKVRDTKDRYSTEYITSIKTTVVLSEYIKNQYGTDSTLLLHNSSLTNGAGDNNYRYAGASDKVNNFVCFGNDEENCPNDNLYRIIGVFNETNIETGKKETRVKLIKYDYAMTNLLGTDGGYNNTLSNLGYGLVNYIGNENVNDISGFYWNNSQNATSTSDWTKSLLNKINLNFNYLNSIDKKYKNLIAENIWKISGCNSYDICAKSIFDKEMSSSGNNFNSKVGLIYVSDYMYAAKSIYWTLQGYNKNDATKDYRTATSDNWIYMGLTEWTISPYSTYSALRVERTGYIDPAGSKSVYTYGYAVRPSFYLNSNVTLISGYGTMLDPYRIS